MPAKRCSVLLLSLLLTASTPLLASPPGDDSQVDYGPLGKGQVQVSFLQAPTGAVVLEMSTDLEAVAGMVAATADRNLVAIVSGESRGSARRALAGLEAEAKLEIGGASLAGQRPQVVLPSSLAGETEIRLTLISQEGKSYPMVFQAADFAGLRLTVSFNGLGGNCRDITLMCSNGCQKTVNCCSILSCSSCTPCEIIRGQGCLPIKPAE
jgi:hypothetical protein